MTGADASWSATVHASAVLVGARAVLIRGPSGTGKSRLALELIAAAAASPFRLGRLVGDDRVHLKATGGRLLVRPAAALAGLVELRGVGILKRDYEPLGMVGLVVDLEAPDAARLPEAETVTLEGIILPRLAVAPGIEAAPAVLAMMASVAA